MNGVYKGKKRRFDQISKENDTNYKDHEEYQYKKLRKALQDNSKHRYVYSFDLFYNFIFFINISFV